MADISATEAGRKVKGHKGRIEDEFNKAVNGPAEEPADDGSEPLGMSQADFADPKKKGLVDSASEPRDDGFKRISKYVRVRVKKS